MEHEAALLQAIPAIVISMDAEGRVTQWNQTATETLGLTEAEVRGQPWDALPLAWDRKRLRAALDTLSAGGVVAQIDAMAFRTRDGQGRVLGFKVSRFTSAEGPGFILAGLDVTRRKELERRVQRVERLEAIGQLAAGIAHEINTPIQFVGDNLGFIGDILERVLPVLPLLPASALSKQGVDLEFIQAELPGAIQQSLEGVQRVASIVRAMKELSHPATDDKSPVDLNRLIESVGVISRNEWKYSAELITDLQAGLPLVTCYADGVAQALLNLVVNAAHAVSERKGAEAGRGRIVIRSRARGGLVDIEVEDDGTGMTPEVARRCFDPFFTTKAVGQGTGQGLALVHAVVVEQHGGELDLQTKPGQGTTFRLTLPTLG